MPKLVINAADDEFLQGDNDFYWWDSMVVGAGKFRQICQNAEHSEATGIPSIIHDIAAWGNAFLLGEPWPQFNWTISPDNGDIVVVNNPAYGTPTNVTMWWAPSYPTKGIRDWRCTATAATGYPDTVPQPYLWKPISLTETAPGSQTWLAHHDVPSKGWMAFFVELFFEGPAPFIDPGRRTQYRLTTQMSIVPKNVWYFPDCYGEGCYGTLV